MTEMNFDIESMLEDRVIRVLETVQGLEGLTILSWDDQTDEQIYPVILVKAGPSDPLDGTKNGFLGNSVLLTLAVFTDKASDSTSRFANHLRGILRYTMSQN